MAKIAINGFGRIGRLFFRQAFERPELDIVAINDLGDIENEAYLLKYDSVYRAYPKSVEVKRNSDGVGGTLIVDGKEIAILQEKDPTKLPWGKLGIDAVVESTGVFESFEKASVHLAAGAKKVVITAPAKDAEGTAGGETILLGVNEGRFAAVKLSSNGSCTTNATSPLAAVMAESVGVAKAILTTVHAYTATQGIVDGPVKGTTDFRRGRAAAQNISPSTTGAAISVARVIKELDGKFDGVAIRVPIITGSLADFTFVAKRKTSVEEINDIFRAAAKSPRWEGVIKVTDDQLVSSDVIGEPYGVVVDSRLTKVMDGDLVKVMGWYDNEWGYVTTLVKHVVKAAENL